MGLLGGMLLGAAAGGMKGYADTFTEQVKQEALQAREMNMLRIQNLFTKEGRKETQDFTKLQDTANFERGIKQREVEAGITEKKEATRYTERKGEEATEYERRVALEEKTYGRRKGEDEVTYQRRRQTNVEDAITIAKEQQKLKDGGKGELQKNYDTMKNVLGETEAKSLFTLSLTKEATAEDRVKLSAAATLTAAMLKTGEYTSEQAKTLFRENMAEVGLSLNKAAPAKTTGDFSLQSILSNIKGAGSGGAKKTFIEEDSSLGLIGSQTQAPPQAPFVDKRSPEMKAAADNLRGAASAIKSGLVNSRTRAEAERKRIEEDRKQREEEEAAKAKNR